MYSRRSEQLSPSPPRSRPRRDDGDRDRGDERFLDQGPRTAFFHNTTETDTPKFDPSRYSFLQSSEAPEQDDTYFRRLGHVRGHDHGSREEVKRVVDKSLLPSPNPDRKNDDEFKDPDFISEPQVVTGLVTHLHKNAFGLVGGEIFFNQSVIAGRQNQVRIGDQVVVEVEPVDEAFPFRHNAVKVQIISRNILPSATGKAQATQSLPENKKCENQAQTPVMSSPVFHEERESNEQTEVRETFSRRSAREPFPNFDRRGRHSREGLLPVPTEQEIEWEHDNQRHQHQQQPLEKMEFSGKRKGEHRSNSRDRVRRDRFSPSSTQTTERYEDRRPDYFGIERPQHQQEIPRYPRDIEAEERDRRLSFLPPTFEQNVPRSRDRGVDSLPNRQFPPHQRTGPVNSRGSERVERNPFPSYRRMSNDRTGDFVAISSEEEVVLLGPKGTPLSPIRNPDVFCHNCCQKGHPASHCRNARAPRELAKAVKKAYHDANPQIKKKPALKRGKNFEGNKALKHQQPDSKRY